MLDIHKPQGPIFKSDMSSVIWEMHPHIACTFSHIAKPEPIPVGLMSEGSSNFPFFTGTIYPVI